MYKVVLPTGKVVPAAGLDTLAEIAQAGVIHAETPIYDIETGRAFLALEHPFLKARVKPAPPSPITQPKPSKNTRTRTCCPNCQTDYAPRARRCSKCSRVRDQFSDEEMHFMAAIELAKDRIATERYKAAQKNVTAVGWWIGGTIIVLFFILVAIGSADIDRRERDAQRIRDAALLSTPAPSTLDDEPVVYSNYSYGRSRLRRGYDSSPRNQHVSGYTRRDGTRVRSYYRRSRR